ncbi:MAG TPA: hypothetical protein VHL54_03460 [Actinomycetota bacterium]|nr:hypothetical protein [Actinomycetota bacterium]
MSRDRFWITLVDVIPDTPDNQDWLEYFGDRAAGGFVHVMGMARSPAGLQEAITAELARHRWVPRAFDDLELLTDLKAREPLSQAFEEMEAELLRSGELQFGRFFLYPSKELATTDWLAREAEDPRLSFTQSTVLNNLSGMFRQLSLPRLDEGIGLTGQGRDVLEIHFPHREETELDLTIQVRVDEEITVDYEYGHVHFNPGVGEDWVSQALDFVYGALQGGVKVEIWATGDKLEKSRASILLDNGEWYPLALWSATPDPPPTAEPQVVKLLSFTYPEGSG